MAKITSACNCIFQVIDQQNDLGNDAYIEFVVDQASTGCCIAAQIKSGSSYVRNGKFVIPADERHFEYWRSHALPICGFVYDPESDMARWVDISAYLADTEAKSAPYSIRVPEENIFDENHFSKFRDHFLAYRTRFSDPSYFGNALADFSHLDNSSRCRDGIRALFSFHRNRPETWYFLISTLTNFRGHALLPMLVGLLAHVPGHMDIFWSRGNIISEPARKNAELRLKQMLSHDLVLTLVSTIENEAGIGRGTIGQCVHAIVALASDRRSLLEPIVFDTGVPEDLRYWVLILLVEFEQYRHVEYALGVIQKAIGLFSADDQERLRWLHEMLKKDGHVDFS
jgi:hypothetical protein